MTVEILFREVCSIYGDNGNIEYMKLCLPDAEFIETPFTDTPYFAGHEPDIIYIGSMSESRQRKVIEKLMPYKERINELCEKGTVLLATGNAADIFCRKIDYVTEKITTEALGMFGLDVKTDFFDRWNGKVLGDFNGIKIVAFRSQFDQIYGDNSKFCFFPVIRGSGLNRDSRYEGMRKNNFFCTTTVGPLLPLNPEFCEYFLKLAGADVKAALRTEAMNAYTQRLKEMEDPATVFGYNK